MIPRLLSLLAIVASALPAQGPVVLTGIDVLDLENFQRLKGAKVGLITNPTGKDRYGHRTIDVLARARDLELLALFSPEHGPEATAEGKVASTEDAATGLPVHSLYDETREPTPEMLAGLDTLVFDIQDIGCRFYTYISTMERAMRVAGRLGLRFVVLDRPNPLGDAVDGPLLDEGRESFVGTHRIPIQHGMTVGELARMLNQERQLNTDLHVVAVRNWKRCDPYDTTGLFWVNPSPNMRSITQAFLYPGIGMLEFTNLSVGRGTHRPFEVVGAPWIDGVRLCRALRATPLPGVRYVPRRFTPNASRFQGEECEGVELVVTERAVFNPLDLGLHVACALRDLYGETWNLEAYDRLLGHAATLDALRAGKSPAELRALWQDDLAAFAERRKAYLIYQ